MVLYTINNPPITFPDSDVQVRSLLLQSTRLGAHHTGETETNFRNPIRNAGFASVIGFLDVPKGRNIRVRRDCYDLLVSHSP